MAKDEAGWFTGKLMVEAGQGQKAGQSMGSCLVWTVAGRPEHQGQQAGSGGGQAGSATGDQIRLAVELLPLDCADCRRVAAGREHR